MAEGQSPAVGRSAQAILRYLDSHPAAMDTLEGIAGWWLQREWHERMFAEVERALDLLLSRRLILETRRPGQPGYYRLNPDRRDTIAEILAGARPEQS